MSTRDAEVCGRSVGALFTHSLEAACTLSEALAIATVLNEICAFTGWPIGHAYRSGETDPEVLAPTGIWYLNDPDRYDEFMRLSEDSTLLTDTGLPGQVLKNRQAEWVPQFAKFTDCHRSAAARKAGLVSGIGIPVIAGDQILFILEFFSSRHEEKDSVLLAQLEQLGRILGLILSRVSSARGHERQALIMSQVSDIVLVADSIGRIVDWNRGTEHWFGYSSEELRRMHTWELVADRANWRAERRAALGEVNSKGCWRGQLHARKKNGEVGILDMVLTPGVAEQGAQTTLGVGRDVSEWVKANRTRKRQALIMEQISDPILVIDDGGVITDCNPATIATFGFARDELLGQDGAMLMAEPRDWKRDRRVFLNQMKKTGRWHSETRVKTRDGNFRDVDVSATAMIGEAGSREGSIAVLHDITEQRALERQLRQSQKMEAIGKLTGGLAHEFNNLLTAVLGNLEFIQREAEPKSDVALDAAAAIEAASKGAEIMKRLLAYARQQPLQPESTMVDEFLRGMTSQLDRVLDRGITVHLELGSELGCVQVDRSQLEHCILNLVKNSLDASDDNSLVTLSTYDSKPAHQGRDGSAVEYVAIEVKDQGRGMNEDEQNRAFDPFFTSKAIGAASGLGLSTVYGFVSQSGGYVDISSKPGSGTLVTMYFPKRDTKPQERPMPKPRQDFEEGVKTVLIVDDEPGVLAYSRRVIESLGFRVITALDGDDAKRVIAGPQRVDLLFSDVMLKNGMNGHDIARCFMSQRPNSKIVLTSGYDRQAIEQQAELEPNWRFLVKPFRRRQLAEMLRSVLGDTPA